MRIGLRVGDAAQLHDCLRQSRQRLVELLHLLFELEAQQATDACAHRCVRGFAGIEETNRHAVAVIDQRGIAGELAPGALERNLRRHVAAIPRRQTRALDAGLSLGKRELRCLT